MRRFFLVLICQLTLAWGGVCHAGTILVFGDSLSAGYGLRSEEAWPSLLQAQLGKTHNVVNASVSGETSSGGRSRLAAALAAHQPSVVVLALGANDGLRGLPLKAMRENLSAMAAMSRAAGARVLIAGMQLPPNYGPDYSAGFQASFGAVAKASDSALLPFLLEGVAAQRELFQADGLHPVAAAQGRIRDNVWAALKPLLAARPKS